MRRTLAWTTVFGCLFTAILALAQGETAPTATEPPAAKGDSVEAVTPPPDGVPDAAGSAAEVEPDGATPDVGAAPATAAAAEASPSAIDEFFNGTNAENLKAKTDAFYAPDATLEDPFGRFEGRDQIVEHLGKLLDGVTAISYEIKAEFVSGDETVALWTMTLAHKSLRSGDSFKIEGVSHVRFLGGRAVAQRDYYDLGTLLYENTPIVGRIVRWVKNKAADL